MADIRRNHRDLTTAQKTAFVNAVLALKNDVESVLHPGDQKRYDDYVEVHKNAMMGPAMFEPMPHGSPLFFPWHRILLRQFELDLQKAANDATITLPYWDWDQSQAGTPFTADFLGGDGDRAQAGRVTSGPFAFAAGKFRIIVADDPQDDPWLRRDFGEDFGRPSADPGGGILRSRPRPLLGRLVMFREGAGTVAAQPGAQLDRRQHGGSNFAQRSGVFLAPYLHRLFVGAVEGAASDDSPLSAGDRRPEPRP